jgi:hypothetical protein
MAEYNSLPENIQTPSVEPTSNKGDANPSRTWLYVIIGIVVVGLIALAIYGLMTAQGDTTSRIRDVFIIFMAFETMVIGVVLVILVIQLAELINLLQNEVKPILESTKETVNSLRGTTAFLGDNLVSPVIKANSYAAGVRRLLELFKIIR